MLDGVEESHLLVHDEVVIVCCTVWRDIAVKIPNGPIDYSYPINIRFDFYGLHLTSFSYVVISAGIGVL
jgi:hypothetical protein